MKLNLNFEDGDQFYEAWLDAHQGLEMAESFEFNARLILLLANQIGQASTLQKCLEAAAHKNHGA